MVYYSALACGFDSRIEYKTVIDRPFSTAERAFFVPLGRFLAFMRKMVAPMVTPVSNTPSNLVIVSWFGATNNDKDLS